MNLVDKLKIIQNYLFAGNYQKVLENSQIILKKIPNNSFLLNLIGMAYQGLFQYQKSVLFFRDAIRNEKNNKAAMNNLANSLKAIGEYEESEQLYEKILKLDPEYINAYNNFANLKISFNDYEGAILLMEKAINICKEKNKNSLDLMFSLASSYLSINEINKSKNLIKKILKEKSDHVGAHKLYSTTLKYNKNNQSSIKHIDQMEKILSKNKFLNEEEELLFTLGKAYDDLKEFDKAYNYLSKANKIKNKKNKSNVNQEIKIFKDIENTFKKVDLKSSKKVFTNKKIIFICGMPRSGTTLMEQIISSHSKVYGAGELIYLNRIIYKEFIQDQKLIKEKIQENLEKEENSINDDYFKNFSSYKIKENIITDKAPQNFKWIGFIKIFFPNCKIIHCQRDPKDNCLSIFKNNFASSMMNWSYDEEDIASYYNSYKNLMKFWKQKIPNFILDINYENLISSKKTEVKKILDFCNLDWDEKCINHHKNNNTPIKTVSVSQAREPIYQDSINSSKAYQTYLDNMLKKVK